MKNFKKSTLFLFCFICGISIFAQTNVFPTTGSAGVGTTDPNPSSMLDIVSTTKGILVPRMTKTQRDAIVSPAIGLLIYQTNVNPGFFYYTGSSWTAISSSDASKTLNNLTTTAVNVTLQPGVDNTTDLGSTTLSWKDLYVDGIGNLGTAKVGNYLGTPQSGMIRYNGTDFQGFNGSSWLTFSTGVGGGDGASQDLSNLTTTNINVDLIPISDGIKHIGDSLKNWKDIYASGTLFINNEPALTKSGPGAIILGNTENATIDELAFSNIVIGNYAAKNIQHPSYGNVIMGYEAAQASSIFSSNTIIGRSAGKNSAGSKNVIIGFEAGSGTSDVDENVFVGYWAGKDQTGYYNTFIGAQSGRNNTGFSNFITGSYAGINNSGNNNFIAGEYAGADNQGSNNIFLGKYSGKQNTTGTENTFIGNFSGEGNTTGSYNSIFGGSDLGYGNIGDYNSVFGYKATTGTGTGNSLFGAFAGANIIGNENTIMGYYAGTLLNTGSGNLLMGAYAGAELFSGSNNVCLGFNSGNDLSNGSANVFVGINAGRLATSSSQNVFVGNSAGFSNTTGANNTAIGTYAGNDLSTAGYNTFLGSNAGFNVSTTGNNTAIGALAGDNYEMSNCTFLGYSADILSSGLSNAIGIGYNATVSASNTIRIGNTSITKLGIGKNASAGNVIEFQVTTAKLTTGGVWTDASDRKLKKDFIQLDKNEILKKIIALPVTEWNYIADSSNIRHIGPMAQDFYSSFGLGDDSTIAAMDKAGVALIGIQALNEQNELQKNRLNEIEKENADGVKALNEQDELQKNKLSAIEKENAELKARLEKIESLLYANGSTEEISVAQKIILSEDKNKATIEQNIPNPFNGKTLIQYFIPDNCNIAQIEIMNAQGVHLKTILLEKGKGMIEIDASGIVSGSYSYSLVVDGKILETKQMIQSK